MRIAIGLVAGALSACAAGGGNRPAGGDGSDAGVVGTLSIATPSSELLVTNGVPAHATFTATLTLSDSTTRDVTADTMFTIDPLFGSFTANDLAISAAGKIPVTGTYAGKTATVDVTARVKSVRIDPSLPPTTPALFAGTDNPALAPQAVYPADGVVMPRNLGDFEIHWTDAHTNNVFEVSLKTEFSDVRVYVPGGNGLAAQGPTPSWTAFQAKEWLDAVGRQSAVSYQVRGVNTATPGSIGGAPARTIQLTGETLDGGLYYWATTSTTNAIGIFRHDMTRPGLPAEPYLTSTQVGGRCIGCHMLSRDGSRMTITFQDDGSPPGPAAIVDVAKRSVSPQDRQWNFATFTPDSAQVLTVKGGTLVVRNAVTRSPLATMPTDPANTWVTHPELSPDGTRLVYVRVGTTNTDFDFRDGHIYVRSYDASTREFGPEQPLVNDSANNFYPSWSPDGTWIVFNKNLGNAYDDNTSAVWVIKADGSAPAIELAKANDTTGLTNSWPRFAPFSQTLGAANQPMYWITISSKRDFGVRLRNTGLAQRGATGKRSQLWMTPFLPAKAAAGMDPSTPMFRLPFQDLESSNLNGQWTEHVLAIQ